ncbi:MAG: response regulator [Rudaea sp.]
MSATVRAGSSHGAPPHLLVVDDDVDVISVIERYFGNQGFRVSRACNGDEMRERIAAEAIDVVLLDLGLPGEDGLDLTRYLRTHWRGALVIVSGRGDSVDRIVGLELGADDYVTKPFDLRELLARVRSVLRRTAQESPASGNGNVILSFEGFRLNTQSRSLAGSDGGDIALTSGEFDLLHTLAKTPNRVLSRDDLMNHLHGRDAGPYDRAIDVQIGRLRRKIEKDPAKPELIKSVRGAGYLFAAPVRRE